MRRRRPRRGWAALLALLLIPSRAARPDDEGEDVAQPLPWHASEDTVFLKRVVAAATGRPIAGATVKLFAEVPHPEPRYGTPSATATSNANGWVRIRQADLDAERGKVYGDPTWVYVEAAGFGPDAESGLTTDGTVWELRPAADLRVAIRDPLDRPVADALVTLLLGCGHTPDVRRVHTSADGVAVIPGAPSDPRSVFRGQLWFVKEGFASTYLRGGRLPWERPTPTRVGWGSSVEGRVLTHEGGPAADVAVGFPEFHRGPWSRTDADGRFRLVGLDAGTDRIQVDPREYAVGPGGAERPYEWPISPEGTPVLIRLPAPEAEQDFRGHLRLVVEIRTPDWVYDATAQDVEILAVRKADGWTARASVGLQGVALLDVEPGDYVVHARATRDAHELDVVWSRGRADATVPKEGGAYASVTLPAPAKVLVDILDESLDLELVGEGAGRPVVDDAGPRIDLDVPPDRPVWLRVSKGERSRLVPLSRGGLEPGGRANAVRVLPFPTLTVRATLVGPDGLPAPGWLLRDGDDERSSPPAPSAAHTLEPDEPLSLVAWPADAVRLQPVRVEVPSAEPTDGRLDVGTVRFPARAPRLEVVDDEGRTPVSATLLVTRGPRQEEVETGDEGEPGFVRDPWDCPGLLGEGAIVRVRRWSVGRDERPVPFARTLEGPGPWRIEAPRGSLLLDLRDAEDAACPRTTIHLDGSRWVEEASGLVGFVGMQAGPHEVVVEAEGRPARRLAFTLAEGGAREWRPGLRSPR